MVEFHTDACSASGHDEVLNPSIPQYLIEVSFEKIRCNDVLELSRPPLEA